MMYEAQKYCDSCHLAIAVGEKSVTKPYGDYHESCFFKLCKHQTLKTAVQVFAAILVLLVFSSSSWAASELSPTMTCITADEHHVFCEFHHYFKGANPQWQVFLDGRLVADESSLQFKPVIDESWRTIQATIPNGENKVVFQVDVRMNPSTKSAEYHSNNNFHAEQVAYTHPP